MLKKALSSYNLYVFAIVILIFLAITAIIINAYSQAKIIKRLADETMKTTAYSIASASKRWQP